MLNELDNGILIAKQMENDTLALKYHNSKIDALLGQILNLLEADEQSSLFDQRIFQSGRA